MALNKLATLNFIILFTFLLLSNATAVSFEEKHVEVALRMIGHKVLLNAGDSSSRVMPIIKGDSQYEIKFESQFAFNPDELVNTVNEVMIDGKISEGYILQVEECESNKVVYSYEIGDLNNIDIIPCKSRDLPKSCYSLIFTLANDKQNSLVAENSNYPDAQGDSNHVKYLASGLLVIFLVVAFFFVRKRKDGSSNTNRNLIEIGKYQFDHRSSALILHEQREELTGKEADLLLLLYENINTTVKRENILGKVWGDEGDYIGRTLDVFISKLRKKLEADPDVKIVNVRGVGYKLLVD